MNAYIAFHGPKRLAAGDLSRIATAVKDHFRDETVQDLLVFDARSHVVDIDFRGNLQHVLLNLPPEPQQPESVSEQSPSDTQRGPGRPKLGVIAKEVTLLPRHWDWLSTQPGGASVALRKLVEEARRANADKDRLRAAQEISYRFMSTMLSNEANFEEASRALFAGQRDRFTELIAPWPDDLREHLAALADASFAVEKGDQA